MSSVCGEQGEGRAGREAGHLGRAYTGVPAVGSGWPVSHRDGLDVAVSGVGVLGTADTAPALRERVCDGAGWVLKPRWADRGHGRILETEIGRASCRERVSSPV